jgi:hypothetical protein
MIFTGAYPPFYRKVNLYFDGCRHVKTGGNTFDVAFPGKNIFMKNMRKQDLEQLAGQRLQLVTHLEE